MPWRGVRQVIWTKRWQKTLEGNLLKLRLNLDRDAARRFVPRDEQRADNTALTVFAGMSTFA